jgi:hypothetical protein
MARRTAGSVGCGGGPLLRCGLFPPLRCGGEPKVLEKRQGDHHQKRQCHSSGGALPVMTAAAGMSPLSYARHQLPPAVIRHAIWFYLRFTLSYRDVEELLAERGTDVSYETVRRWVVKFGPAIARNLRHLRPKPNPRWHFDDDTVGEFRSVDPEAADGWKIPLQAMVPG